MNLWAKYKGLTMLALLSVVAPLVVWQYAVGGTVAKWRTTAKYRHRIVELRAAQPRNPDTPVAAKTDREMILSGLVVAELLPVIESERLRIEHFSPYVTSEADGIRLTTGQLTVEGRFTGMVRLLDRLESELPGCKVISAHYRSARPRNRGAAKTLSCTIYIQQITEEYGK